MCYSVHNLLCLLTGPFTNICQQAYKDRGERALYLPYLLCTDISAIDNGYLCGSLVDVALKPGERASPIVADTNIFG